MRKLAEAESLLLGSYPILTAKRSASRSTWEARQHHVDLYEAWGKPDKARRYAALPGKAGSS
jgi:hypothetical protein